MLACVPSVLFVLFFFFFADCFCEERHNNFYLCKCMKASLNQLGIDLSSRWHFHTKVQFFCALYYLAFLLLRSYVFQY